MRQSRIKQIRAHFVLVFLTIVAACQADFQVPNGEPQEVGFYVGGNETRTEMLQNGLSAVWSAGDELALWARNSAGGFALSNQIFKTYGIDGKLGYFTSTLPQAMDAGTYTYYSTYPVPESVNGTKATFNLPSVQDGNVTGGADIMIAEPVSHGALTAVPDPEDHSGMSMQMHRMMHQFRFYVPQDDTKLGDKQIERILLDFPKPVVGKVTLDFADPAAAPVLTDGSGSVTLNLSEPIAVTKEGDYDYACVAINPVSFAGSTAYLNLKAYTSDQIVLFDPIDLCKRTFEAGHSTPVKLKIKSIVDYPYQISFTVAANNLGENPLSIRLEAPSGCVWPESGSNVYVYEPGGEINVNTKFTFYFEDEAQYRKFSQKSVNVTYDSENAITKQTVTFANLSSTDKTNLNLTVPYLFFEDFSGIPTFSDGHDNMTVISVNSIKEFWNLLTNLGNVSDTYVGISEVSNYSLNGWYGARIGGQSGKAIRVCCRYEHVAIAGAYYKGRVYTPALTNIKDAKNVSISVSFDYGTDRKELNPGAFGDPADKSPVMFFGVNTESVVSNPDAVEGDILDKVTGLYGKSGYASERDISLAPRPIDGETLAKSGGSYTSTPTRRTVTINNVDNAMRLAWVLSTDNTKGSVHGNYWLYLDNIKVQIKK